VRSTAWQSTRSVLGLGRKARHKISPVLVIVVGFLPAVVFVGITAFIGNEIFEPGELIPEFAELPRNSIAAIVLFTGLVAPEAMVRDRRDGMLSLYLSTPLTRITYLVSKLIAVVGTLAIIVVLPTILYLLGLTFASAGPDGFLGWLQTLVRILFSGFAASLVYALVSMACASLTDRRAFASVAVIMVMLGLVTVISILINSADASVHWRLLDPLNIPLEMVERIFGGRGEYPEISSVQVYAANLGWAGASSALIWSRYRSAGA
jgi:ABC-2 type transport system permease protein